jgi:hypothetical protein
LIDEFETKMLLVVRAYERTSQKHWKEELIRNEVVMYASVITALAANRMESRDDDSGGI